MCEFKEFKRVNMSEMRPFIENEDLTGVSISPEDEKAGSPKVGDMIARNPLNHKDKWLVSDEYFCANFALVEYEEKSLQNTTADGAKKNVKDIQFWGYGDMFRLISKAWSKEEGWMKSTKAMQLPHGVLIQVTTQQWDNVAEAIEYVPGIIIVEVDKNGKEYKGGTLKEQDIVSRIFIPIG